MTIIGPTSRKPDDLAPGMRWCKCGLHIYPAMIGQHRLRTARGCPSCYPADFMPHAQAPVHVVTWLSDDSQRIPHANDARPGDGHTGAMSA